MSLFASTHASQETASLFINEKIASARLKVFVNIDELILKNLYRFHNFVISDNRLVERMRQCSKNTGKMRSPKENSGIDGPF